MAGRPVLRALEVPMPAVVVVGAGIAGCAAALALDRAGVPVVVREAHPESSEDAGAFLTIASGGVRALAELGVLDAVDAVGGRLRRFREQANDGTVLSTRELGRGGPAYRFVTRGRLCGVLQEAVEERGIELIRDARVVAVEGDLGAVETVDAHGRRDRADVVVAADGVHSGLRPVVDPGGPPPRYVGQRIFFGWSTRTDLGVVDDFHAVHGPSAFGYIPTGSGTWWFARVTAAPLGREALTGPDVGGLLRGHLAGIQAEIAGASTGTWVTNGYDLPWVGRWSARGVLLVGDAAHAASPATGQGASMAVEDGLVLGKAFRDRGDPAAALEAFRVARADHVQANIVASARHGTPDQPILDAPQGHALSDEELAAHLDWESVLG